MKKILITGGIGFIGSSLALKLINNRYQVILFDIRDNNKNKKIYLDNKNIEFILGDTNDTSLLERIFESNNIDGVIHLAAISRVIIAQKNPSECKRTNIGGTKSLLKAIEKTSSKPWLIFGSSREVYGEPEKLPVKEYFKKKFINIYGETKIQGEQLFINFANKHNISCVILRFANVYGNEYDLFDRVLPRFIYAISNQKTLTIEGGEQVIDFTHIDDTVDSIVKVIKYIENNKKMIEDFHILPGIGWTLDEAISIIEKFIGNKASIKVNKKRNFDVEKFIGDNSKIKKNIQIRKFLTLEEGLKKSIPIYLEQMKKMKYK